MSFGLFNIHGFSGLSDHYPFKKHVITRAKKEPDETESTLLQLLYSENGGNTLLKTP